MQGTDGYVVSLHLLILTKEDNVREINGKAGLHVASSCRESLLKGRQFESDTEMAESAANNENSCMTLLAHSGPLVG